jgi:hypothetical protein
MLDFSIHSFYLVNFFLFLVKILFCNSLEIHQIIVQKRILDTVIDDQVFIISK